MVISLLELNNSRVSPGREVRAGPITVDTTRVFLGKEKINEKEQIGFVDPSRHCFFR